MSKLIKELEELPRFNSGDNSCFDLIELLDVIEIINKHQITEATNDSTAIIEKIKEWEQEAIKTNSEAGCSKAMAFAYRMCHELISRTDLPKRKPYTAMYMDFNQDKRYKPFSDELKRELMKFEKKDLVETIFAMEKQRVLTKAKVIEQLILAKQMLNNRLGLVLMHIERAVDFLNE